MTRREAAAVGALAVILAITAAWWTLALWPAPPGAPEWLERTRAVCFGVMEDGLPSLAGWIVLVGEPLGMLAFLFVVWGGAVRDGLLAMRRSAMGQLLLAAGGGALAIGALSVVGRVRGGGEVFSLAAADARPVPQRVHRPAPALALVSHTGDSVNVRALAGHPVVVAFAYAHCETVCPGIVHEVASAVRVAKEVDAQLLVVTLDPWRDTPARLPHIAKGWQLPPSAVVLSGEVASVTATAKAWGITVVRDSLTGEIIHNGTVFVVDRAGNVVYELTAGSGELAALLRRL